MDLSTAPQKLGECLYDVIRSQNETVAEVAERLQVPLTTLKSWFDRNSIPQEELLKLAAHYGLPDDMQELQSQFEFRIARPTRRRRTVPDIHLQGEQNATEIVSIDEPLDPSNQAFCKRLSEAALERQIGRQPFSQGIVGGKLTGKSTAARWFASELKRVGAPVIYFDLSEFISGPIADLKQWINDQSQRQLKLTPRYELTDRIRLADWLNDNVLIAPPKDDAYHSLIFDGVERLEHDIQEMLFIELHHIFTKRTRNQRLDYLNIVATSDEPLSTVIGVHQSAAFSSFFRTAAVVRAGNFYDGLVSQLVSRRCPALSPPIHSQIATAAWTRFRGHPSLTQCWLNTVAQWDGPLNDKVLLDADEECLALVSELFHDRFPYRQDIANAVTSDSRVPSNAQGLVYLHSLGQSPLGPTAFSWLQDTGLFFLVEGSDALCCTSWVAEALTSGK